MDVFLNFFFFIIIMKQHGFKKKKDQAAQKVIVGALRKRYRNLKITGEEEESDDDNEDDDAFEHKNTLDTLSEHEFCKSAKKIKKLGGFRTIPLNCVEVFVDPVDGTREFVEGRLRNVQTLIGIAIRGRASAGVIGLPFWRNDENGILLEPTEGFTSTGSMICGMVHLKVFHIINCCK